MLYRVKQTEGTLGIARVLRGLFNGPLPTFLMHDLVTTDLIWHVAPPLNTLVVVARVTSKVVLTTRRY